MTPEKITKNFQRCKDWEERYCYLIELGERFSTLPKSEQSDQNRIQGCQSQVWVSYSKRADILNMNANSDAAIVRGLLALIIIAYNEKPLALIHDFDIQAWFDDLGLHEHLTPTRTIGLHTIIKEIKKTVISSN